SVRANKFLAGILLLQVRHCAACQCGWHCDREIALFGAVVIPGHSANKSDECVGQCVGLDTATREKSMTAQKRTTTDEPHVLRDVAEQSAAQAKENLETMSAAAGEANTLLKHGLATTLKGTQDYSAEVLEFAQADISAAVEHVTKLSSAKSPMEFFALS